MMYAKLILRSARRSARDYLVYIVTLTICTTLFYAFLSVSSRFYKPDIGVEYNFTVLSDGMKVAICAVTLLLVFLIRFVNRYMLHSRQQEFALEAMMGMEQRTIGRLFFAETLIMGGAAVIMGIGLGAVCSQFPTSPPGPSFPIRRFGRRRFFCSSFWWWGCPTPGPSAGRRSLICSPPATATRLPSREAAGCRGWRASICFCPS